MSQAQLAEVSGISQPNISAIEHDRRQPSADTLNRLVVSCGFVLTAMAGERVVQAPLPKAGWFPDEDLPPRLPDDPPDEPSEVGPDTPMERRLELIDVVFERVNIAVNRGLRD